MKKYVLMAFFVILIAMSAFARNDTVVLKEIVNDEVLLKIGNTEIKNSVGYSVYFDSCGKLYAIIPKEITSSGAKFRIVYEPNSVSNNKEYGTIDVSPGEDFTAKAAALVGCSETATSSKTDNSSTAKSSSAKEEDDKQNSSGCSSALIMLLSIPAVGLLLLKK